MTLRRLNIEIQGYPESYAAEPIDMVGSEVGPLYSPPPPSSLSPQSRDDDGTTNNAARPPLLDNAAHVNLGGEHQHQGDSSSKNYESGPLELPPSPTNENNKRIKTSPTL